MLYRLNDRFLCLEECFRLPEDGTHEREHVQALLAAARAVLVRLDEVEPGEMCGAQSQGREFPI